MFEFFFRVTTLHNLSAGVFKWVGYAKKGFQDGAPLYGSEPETSGRARRRGKGEKQGGFSRNENGG